MTLLPLADKTDGNAKSGETTNPTKVKLGEGGSRNHTNNKPKPEYLQHTAGDIETFYLRDNAGTEWALPWSRTRLNFQTTPGSGRVRIFGDAPLEFAWA